MNINAKIHPVTSFDVEAKRSGVGANALWDGPLDTTAFAKGKGYSGGTYGMSVSMASPKMACGCPITKRAKGVSNGSY